jgi:hypothetical protein
MATDGNGDKGSCCKVISDFPVGRTEENLCMYGVTGRDSD